MCLTNGPYNIASLGWLNVQFHMIGATFFSIQEYLIISDFYQQLNMNT